MAAEAESKRLDRRIAWTAKVGGLGAAVIGIFGPEKLILPGLAFAGGGFVYERVTDPDRGENRMRRSGTIFQRAREIFVPGRRAKAT